MPKIALEIVVLPDPDSPTRPNVSPTKISKFISFAAFTIDLPVLK